MAAAFAAESGGLCLDDACESEDMEIFNLWNRANGEHKPLIAGLGHSRLRNGGSRFPICNPASPRRCIWKSARRSGDD